MSLSQLNKEDLQTVALFELQTEPRIKEMVRRALTPNQNLAYWRQVKTESQAQQVPEPKALNIRTYLEQIISEPEFKQTLMWDFPAIFFSEQILDVAIPQLAQEIIDIVNLSIRLESSVVA